MKAIRGNIIVKIDVSQKTKYRLSDDIVIEILKGYSFNQREERAAYGYIINGEGHSKGERCLCHYLAMEQNYHIENETILT